MNLRTWVTDNKPLMAILAVALALRLAGIQYGLPSMYNSDEPVNVIQALSYGAKKSLEPTYYGYPTLYSYTLFTVYGLCYAGGRLFGSFSDPLDFGAAYFLNPTWLFMVGRILSVILGVAGVWVVYKMASRFLSRQTALVSAAVLALTFTHLSTSHWILLEAALVFMSGLALYFIFRIHDEGTVKSVLVAGLVSGLAISTKYNAGFLFVPLFLTIVLRFKSDLGGMFKTLALGGISILAGFLIGSPYWLVEFDSFFESFNVLLAYVDYGVAGHFSAVPFVWPLWKLIAADWTTGFLMVAGLIYALFQRQQPQILMLAFILPTLFFAGTWTRANLYYMLPLYPALAVLAGMLARDILGQLNHKGWRVAAAVCLLLPPTLKGVYYDLRLTQPDSRAVAEEWIEKNVPESSKVAYENYVYGPNLFDPSRYFDNEFESAILPTELKERILEERRRRTSYNLVNFRKAFKSDPLSNGDLTKGYLQTPYFQRLVQFRLPTISALREAGVEYIIASSENYDRYFKALPPKKSAPAWLSYQNGRRFYLELFESEELSLVREFHPSKWSLGPTIRLYRFNER